MAEIPQHNDITFFAETSFRGERKRFGIKRGDRRRHMYVIGKTGMGKSTLLENMAIQDIITGQGLCVVDPHGEFAEKMLRFVPEHRIRDVVYFNPADTANPLGFNPMEHVGADQRHLVASGLMGVFKKIWPDVWSARMEYILANTILALLEMPDATLLGVTRMLGEKDYRKYVVSNLSDQVVRAFWENEFAKYNDKFMAEAIAPIQNKVGQFVSNPLIRNIIGQKDSTFNIRQAMDEGKILIMNLSKGRVGEENSRLLGAMLITKIYLTAMSRVDIVDESKRRDFYLYVDEFQNFATESFASILSEARKYRLNLILAHQYIAQMDEKVQDAVFGNVGTMVSFRVGPQDADILEKEYSPTFLLQDIISLGFAQIYLKLMIDGVASSPFMATTLAPMQIPEKNYTEDIIRSSREFHAQPQETVEKNMTEWFGQSPVPRIREGESPAEERRERPSRDPNRQMFQAKCAVDGEVVMVPFQPDDRRPIYCERHLAMMRAGELPAPAPRAPSHAAPRPDERPPMRTEHRGEMRRDTRQERQPMREQPEHFQRGRHDAPSQPRPMQMRPPPIQRSEPVVRMPDSQERISLNLLKKEPAQSMQKEKREQTVLPQKREINLSALRETLEKNIAKHKESQKENSQQPARTIEEKRPDLARQELDKKAGVIKPGQAIRFD